MPNSGVLLIDKPTEMTSHDLVNIARKVFPDKKDRPITAPLIPNATGVMVLCVGQATRLNEYLHGRTTSATAQRCVLAQRTDTPGQLWQCRGDVRAANAGTKQGFRDVLTRFVGKQEQTPPLYSADQKRTAKPLYRYAREGLAVDDIPKREIEILRPWNAFPYNGEESSDRRPLQQGHLHPHPLPGTSPAPAAAAAVCRRCGAQQPAPSRWMPASASRRCARAQIPMHCSCR